MSVEDILRSFAEAREEDSTSIRNGITYGNIRETMKIIHSLETELEEAKKGFHPSCLEFDERHETLKEGVQNIRNLAGTAWIRVEKNTRHGDALFDIMVLSEELIKTKGGKDV